VDAADHGLVAILQEIPQGLDVHEESLAELAARQGLEIHTGAEGAAGPGHNGHPDLPVIPERVNCLGQVGQERHILGVQLIGPVQRDAGDGAIPAIQNGLLSWHAIPPSMMGVLRRSTPRGRP
jgi:hypothetical protein